MLPSFGLLFITDRRRASLPLAEAVRAALAAIPPGAAAVLLREKDLEGRALAELGRTLLPICRARAAPLLVSDRTDLALALGLDGVQLAQTSFSAAEARRILGPAALIGVSCHSLAELKAALDGATHATFGPLFETPSKAAFGPPLGPLALGDAARLGLPLYALGGITPERVPLLGAAHGVAAIGAALGHARPAEAASKLWAAFQRWKSSGR